MPTGFLSFTGDSEKREWRNFSSVAFHPLTPIRVLPKVAPKFRARSRVWSDFTPGRFS